MTPSHMAPVQFTFTELAALVGLADGKTLSEIASELYLGQPGVSKALQAAGQRTGLQLVEREGYRVRLTAAGQQVASAARAVLDQAQELQRLVESLRRGDAGPVRVMATSTPGNSIVPDIVGAFIQRYASAEVDVRIAQRKEIWEVCVREGFDFAVGPLNRGLQHISERGWRIEPLYHDRITFFVGPGHRLAGRTVSLRELGAEQIIGSFAESYWSDAWEQLNGLGFSAERRMTLLSSAAVKRLVEAGGGVGMLLGLSILREVAHGELVALDLETMPPLIPYGMAVRPDNRPLPIVRIFEHFLRSRMAGVQEQLATLSRA